MPARVITLLSLASAVPSLAAGITKPGVRTPPTMKEVRAAGICGDDFKCVHIDTVSTPVPHSGEALIRVNSSSVNPVDVDTVELQGCTRGCGSDISGIVVDCPGCKTIKAGDEVWTVGQPAYAEYTVVTEGIVSLKPQSLPFQEAATIPIVGLTSFMSLKRTGSLPGTPLPAGSPWASGNYSNLTVAITAGSGGTGFIGIQMAKAWGAKHVFTATTGEGIDFVKSLGADFVVDYTKGELFDSDQLPDNSVDIVRAERFVTGASSVDLFVLLFLLGRAEPTCITTLANVAQSCMPRHARCTTITVPKELQTRRCESCAQAVFTF